MSEQFHGICRTRITPTYRNVDAQPEDLNWPKDVRVSVPYCSSCKRVVNVTDICEKLPAARVMSENGWDA